MDQAQAAQGPFSQRVVTKVGNDQSFFVADDDVFNYTGAIDEDADLTADFNRQLDKAGGKFLAAELRRRDTPTVKPFQSLDVTGLQTCKIAERFFDRNTPEFKYRLR